jgi:hypothetical protein
MASMLANTTITATAIPGCSCMEEEASRKSRPQSHSCDVLLLWGSITFSG